MYQILRLRKVTRDEHHFQRSEESGSSSPVHSSDMLASQRNFISPELDSPSQQYLLLPSRAAKPFWTELPGVDKPGNGDGCQNVGVKQGWQFVVLPPI